MHLPLSVVVVILEMAFEDLGDMLEDMTALGDARISDDVYSEWRAVEEVLYDIKTKLGQK